MGIKIHVRLYNSKPFSLPRKDPLVSIKTLPSWFIIMKTMSACRINVFLVKEHRYGREFSVFRFTKRVEKY